MFRRSRGANTVRKQGIVCGPKIHLGAGAGNQGGTFSRHDSPWPIPTSVIDYRLSELPWHCEANAGLFGHAVSLRASHGVHSGALVEIILSRESAAKDDYRSGAIRSATPTAPAGGWLQTHQGTVLRPSVSGGPSWPYGQRSRRTGLPGDPGGQSLEKQSLATGGRLLKTPGTRGRSPDEGRAGSVPISPR
jgi:hypothetical protein